MPLLLGIDGGGTKTHVVCVNEQGMQIGEGFSGPASLSVTSAGAASFNVREAIRQAIQSAGDQPTIEIVAMGLAGMDTPTEEELARQVFGDVLQHLAISDFILVNDIQVALESGTQAANALAIISGTGSNAWGRSATGLTAKTGGMDSLLTDQGSGYAIGRSVLRRAVKSFDGRAPKTMLEGLICEHFRITSISELKTKVTQPPLTKTEIAELAQVCLKAFDQGDNEAKHIFDDAVDELVLMGSTVLHRLELATTPTDCVLAGSITKIAYLQNTLRSKLTEQFPQLQIIVPTKSPVFGAVLMAQRVYAEKRV